MPKLLWEMLAQSQHDIRLIFRTLIQVIQDIKKFF